MLDSFAGPAVAVLDDPAHSSHRRHVTTLPPMSASHSADGSPAPLYSVPTHGRLEPHVHQEWLLTNGLGGFASSSVVGCNTRRYHGLLIGATTPPVGRITALTRLGEVLCLDGNHDRRHEFSVNQFRDSVLPRGDRYLRAFHLFDGFARWEYEIDGVSIVKDVQLLWMQNVVGVRYQLHARAGRQLELSLLPFTSLRDFHGVRRADDTRFDVAGGEQHVLVGNGGATARLWSDAGHFRQQEDWWYGHVYAIETDRGLNDSEDLFSPGRFVVEGSGSLSVTVWADLRATASPAHQPGAMPAGHEPLPAYDWDGELQRRRTSIASSYTAPSSGKAKPAGATPESASPVLRRLAHAANDFIVYRRSPDGSDGTSVVAGYPWFADWGRDTFISLPGLLLTTGRYAQARQVLGVFAQYVSEGMIPNRFDDYSNEPHYNTVDASLWFIHAAFEYLRHTADSETFERRLRPACRQILDGYARGTRFGIRMDPADGLITQGDASTQLTWMDAKCGGVAYTPRQGKPVEINALWYHALRLMGDDARAEQVRGSFVKTFWISPWRGLADVVGEDGHRDVAVRPNQIFAASLPNSPLSEDQQRAVVEVVRRELLTPFGLRTLSKDNARYVPLYCGPQPQRDAAYHNGAIWPWLIGGFLEAYLKVNRRSAESVTQAKAWLAPLMEHMETTGAIGSISEIFEAQEPHRPVGCPAQAWSIAEVLRLAVELDM